MTTLAHRACLAAFVAFVSGGVSPEAGAVLLHDGFYTAPEEPGKLFFSLSTNGRIRIFAFASSYTTRRAKYYWTEAAVRQDFSIDSSGLLGFDPVHGMIGALCAPSTIPGATCSGQAGFEERGRFKATIPDTTALIYSVWESDEGYWPDIYLVPLKLSIGYPPFYPGTSRNQLLPDLRGDWLFVPSDRAGAPLRVHFDLAQHGVDVDIAGWREPGSVFTDTQRNARLACHVLGCELSVDGRPVLAARDSDVGPQRIHAFAGTLPATGSYIYRRLETVIGVRPASTDGSAVWLNDAGYFRSADGTFALAVEVQAQTALFVLMGPVLGEGPQSYAIGSGVVQPRSGPVPAGTLPISVQGDLYYTEGGTCLSCPLNVSTPSHTRRIGHLALSGQTPTTLTARIALDGMPLQRVSLFRDGPTALPPYTLASGKTLPPLRGSWVFYSPTVREAPVTRVEFDLADIAPDGSVLAFRDSHRPIALTCASDCVLTDDGRPLGRFPLASLSEQVAIGATQNGSTLLLGAKADAEIYFHHDPLGSRLPGIGATQP